jgi:hypothetical protein
LAVAVAVAVNANANASLELAAQLYDVGMLRIVALRLVERDTCRGTIARLERALGSIESVFGALDEAQRYDPEHPDIVELRRKL